MSLLYALSKVKKKIQFRQKKDLDKEGLVHMYRSGFCANVSMNFERDE